MGFHVPISHHLRLCMLSELFLNRQMRCSSGEGGEVG